MISCLFPCSPTNPQTLSTLVNRVHPLLKPIGTAADMSIRMLSQTVEKDDGYTVHVLPRGIQIQRLFWWKKYNNVPAKGRLVQSWPVYNCCLIKQNELPVLLCLRSHRLSRELHLRRKSFPANLCQSKYS